MARLSTSTRSSSRLNPEATEYHPQPQLLLPPSSHHLAASSGSEQYFNSPTNYIPSGGDAYLYTNFSYFQTPRYPSELYYSYASNYQSDHQTHFSLFFPPPRSEIVTIPSSSPLPLEPLPTVDHHHQNSPERRAHKLSSRPSLARKLQPSFSNKRSTVGASSSSNSVSSIVVSTPNNRNLPSHCKKSTTLYSRVFQKPSRWNLCVGREEQQHKESPPSFRRKNRIGCGREAVLDSYTMTAPMLNRRKPMLNRRKKVEEEKEPVLPVKEDGPETSVMIRNIPNQYTRKMLIKFLDNFCDNENAKNITAEAGVEAEGELVAYDFVYLPIDFGTDLNKGYAFVNFTTPKTAWKLYLYNLKDQKWKFYDSGRKRREIACAKIQGKKALIQHFESSTFVCDTEEYLPVVFSPPRMGSSSDDDEKKKQKESSVVQKILGRRFNRQHHY